MDEMDLPRKLFRLEWLLRYHHILRHRDRGPLANIYQGQGRILRLLKLKPDMSQKDLSGILDIRSQSLGELLAKLERAGYITRSPSETDRRIMEIHLTEAGREAAVEEDRGSSLDALFDSLSENEKSNLDSILDKLIGKLEDLLGTGAGEAGPEGFGPGGREGRRRGPFGPRRGGPRRGFDPRAAFPRSDGPDWRS